MLSYKLDKIDREIIACLDENARMSATNISHILAVSKQRVSFRIKRMVKLGILDLFSAIIARDRLGFYTCQLYIKFKKNPSQDQLIEKLKNINWLYWEAITERKFDLMVVFLVKDLYSWHQVYNQTLNIFSNNIKRKEILLVTAVNYLNHSFITGKPKSARLSSLPRKELNLKPMDFFIINAIKECGRLGINELARKIGCTPLTARKKIAYLKTKGVITDFKIRINHNLIGYNHYLIYFSLSNLSEKNNLKKLLIKDQWSIRVTELIGGWDLACDVILPKKESYFGWIKKIKEIKKTPKFKNYCLKVKKVLPINNITYY